MARPPPSARRRSDESLARADVALRMGHTHEAEKLAASVLKADKGNLVAATIMARVLLALNRNDEAVPILERAARRNADPATVTLLAVALAAAGRLTDAISKLQEMTERNVAFPPAFREHVGHLAKQGRVDDAIALAVRGNCVISRRGRIAAGPCSLASSAQRSGRRARSPD